jgi:hypothetical protein
MPTLLDPPVLAGLLILSTACSGSPRTRGSAAVVEIPPAEPAASGAASGPPLPRASRLPLPAPEEAPEVPEEEYDSPWGYGPGVAGGGGGPDCDRAADCCLKFVQTQGPNPALVNMCDAVRHAPTSSCVQFLMSFRSIAPQAGIQCP